MAKTPTLPDNGLDTSKLRSADASGLRLDGKAVAEHGSPDFLCRFGRAALERGFHCIEVRSMNGAFFVKRLELAIHAPDEPLAPVPARPQGWADEMPARSPTDEGLARTIARVPGAGRA